MPLGEMLCGDESLLRGLNPVHCVDGQPTEGCFILKKKDPPDRGPSFGIERQEIPAARLGTTVGIDSGQFATLVKEGWGIARISVGPTLDAPRPRAEGAPLAFHQKPDDQWGDHRDAHAQMAGYQAMTNRALDDVRRAPTRAAARAMVKPASGQEDRMAAPAALPPAQPPPA